MPGPSLSFAVRVAVVAAAAAITVGHPLRHWLEGRREHREFIARQELARIERERQQRELELKLAAISKQLEQRPRSCWLGNDEERARIRAELRARKCR